VAKGLSWFHAGEPVNVNVLGLLAASAKGAPETVFNNKVVFAIEENGAVGVEVIVLAMFESLKLLILPLKY